MGAGGGAQGGGTGSGGGAAQGGQGVGAGGASAQGGAGASGGGSSIDPCAHFRAGNYYREVDSPARGLDAMQALEYAFGAGGPDLTYFTGLLIQIDWRVLEVTKGQYDFSRVDALLARLKQAGKVLRLKVMDRTFWATCNSTEANGVFPDYVTQVAAPQSSICFADTWTKETMDGYIALHVALAKHLDAEASFGGFTTEETATDMGDPSIHTEVYAQRVRLAQELFAAVPNTILVSEFNWPYPNNDPSVFAAMIDATITPVGSGHNGLGIGWPDSFLNPSDYTMAELPTVLPRIQCSHDMSEQGKQPCPWYQLAPSYGAQVVIAPSIEGGTLTGSLEEAEAHYVMLDELGAHMITWETWSQPEPNFLGNVAIPTVNAHQGQLTHATCPLQ